MKSDLTCPVEVVGVSVRRETAQGPQGEAYEQVLCDIEFSNLSAKEVDSIQMNLLCFDGQGKRLGGRFVRAVASGAPRAHFFGIFMPDHVEETARVEAAIEKIWFRDGVIWRREERNIREYTPNDLPEGRELDRLRAVAGPDAAGYPREDDLIWLCVCGRANPNSADMCTRCLRERAQVLRDYSYAVIDATIGRKERTLEHQTRENLRRSSEQTLKMMKEEEYRQKQQKKKMTGLVSLLAVIAVLLAVVRWGVPAGACMMAQRHLDDGQAADAKELFVWVDTYWPGFMAADERAADAERVIIDRLLVANTKETIEDAVERAKLLGDGALHARAVITQANYALDAGDADEALALLAAATNSEAAYARWQEIAYSEAVRAQERVQYPRAIELYAQLGAYQDAAALKEESIYQYGRQLMRSGRYAEAGEQLLQVPTYLDAIALVRQCRYAVAQEAQENGDYIAAAVAYESLGIYEEAETRARLCRYTAGMNALENGILELAAEQLLLAEGYEDAQARYTDVAFTIGSTALAEGEYETAIAWLEKIERTASVSDALNRAGYAYAGELEANGRLEEASQQYAALGDYSDAKDKANALVYAIALSEMKTAPETAKARFDGLGSYRDAKDKAKECRYLAAQSDYAAGAYEDALSEFEALGTYSDAKNQARRSRYALAGQLFDAGKFDEAAVQYAACGAYLEAEERTMRSRYEAAAVLEGEKRFSDAAKAFAELGSYEDAKLRVTKNEDSWLGSAFSSATMDMEIGNYESAIAALEPYWTLALPERFASMEQMYIDACLSRATELIETDRPLDALPFLERIEDVSKSARSKLDINVYKLIGRWKNAQGVEYVFRRDGTCAIDGSEQYFGGSGYDVFLGDAPYPTKKAFEVVSVKKETITLRIEETGKTFRLTYIGEVEDAEQDTDKE